MAYNMLLTVTGIYPLNVKIQAICHLWLGWHNNAFLTSEYTIKVAKNKKKQVWTKILSENKYTYAYYRLICYVSHLLFLKCVDIIKKNFI